MRIIAFTSEQIDKRVVIQNTLNDKITTDSLHKLLEFLYMSIEDTKDVSRATWDIDAFIAPIIQLLTDKELIYLHQKKKFYLNQYVLTYIQGKVVSITQRSTLSISVNYYGIKQYFQDDKRASVPLNELQSYSNDLLEALKLMNMETTKITSPIRIYEDCMLKRLTLPNYRNIPQMALELAEKCAGKLWIEAYKIGYFEKVYDYDMKSAFPSITMDLIDLNYGDWVESQIAPKNALYGYTESNVFIKDDVSIHPIMCKYYDKGIEGWNTPVGNWPTEITFSEIKFINFWKLGFTTIKNGIWFIPHNSSKPYEKAMKEILKFKESDNKVVKTIAKGMSVGVYGKTLEKRDNGFGDYYNPVYGAEITSRTRLHLASFIYRKNAMDNVIAVKVDGFIADKELN